MNSVRAMFAVALFAVTAAPVSAQVPVTLDSAAALPATKLEAERARFLDWLDDPATTISPERMLQAREHLYYLIGSTAQAHRRTTGELFPSGVHAQLAELFERGSDLGLYGAGLVAQALDSSAKLI